MESDTGSSGYWTEKKKDSITVQDTEQGTSRDSGAQHHNKQHHITASTNLTLCVPCIILQCVDNQRDAQFF